MKFLKFIFAVLLFCLIFLMPFNSIFAKVPAQDKIIVSQRIYPDNNLYPYKRLWEKIKEFIVFSNNDQVKFHENLLANRISELKYVSDSRLLSLMQDASQRVSYEAGTVEEKVSVSDNQQKDDVKDLFTVYKTFLPQVRDSYRANSAYWLFIQQNIDTFEILSGELK